MNLKYKFCNIFSEFSCGYINFNASCICGVFLYTSIFSFLVSVIGSITIAVLLCVVLTIIVLVLGSLFYKL
ncbi:hypothetical protein vBCjeMWX1_0120 [Campylobacter phage vB_CjeM_WX1]|nr:hypothetical protein vBCjeMWX1_0120 [Campylobacter phage vB_CjeM_WX1]